MDLRPAKLEDAEAICEIYNYEVLTSTSTFDLEPRSVAVQRAWLAERSGAHIVLVAEIDGAVVGFGSLSQYKPRAAYNTTVEDSVYVASDSQGQGVGFAIIAALVDRATGHGFHTVIARIGHESKASIATHAKAGFVEVGREVEVGRKLGRWVDVIIMQRMLG